MKIMKKYFIAALALVALVACSKNEDGAPEFDGSKKSVEITIGNMASGVRAAGGVTPGVTDNTKACADASDLIVLFADAGGNVVVSKKLDEADMNKVTDADAPADATCYRFHALPENVTQVGVIANVADAPKTLAAAEEAWMDEDAMLAAPYRNVVDNSNAESPTTTYGVVAYSGAVVLENNGNTCTVDGDHTAYPLLEADVEVKPYMARIEIVHLACTDLADTANEGYSKIGFTSLELAGVAGNTNAPYTHTLGSFADAAALESAQQYVVTAAHVHGSDTNYLAPADGKVWSWNITPQAVSNLVVGLYVKGNGYTVQIPEKTVTVNSYSKDGTAISQFAGGNIYRLVIDFKEENIDSNSQFVCADVDVTIADWIINDIEVGFVTPPASTNP